MHGIIHSELKRFIIKKHNYSTWTSVLQEAKLESKSFLISSAYPDTDAIAIINTAAKLTGTDVHDIHVEFGKFIVPTLVKLYGAFIRPNWKTKEMFLNTENTIHRVVRMRNAGAEPPELFFEDAGENKLNFLYKSKRNMSGIAIGIMHGMANYFNETIDIRTEKVSEGIKMLITINK